MRAIFLLFIMVLSFSLCAKSQQIDFAYISHNKDVSSYLKYANTPEEIAHVIDVERMKDGQFDTPAKTPLIVGFGDLRGAGRLYVKNSSNSIVTKLFSIEFEHFQLVDISLFSSRQHARYLYSATNQKYYFKHSVFPVIPITLAPHEEAVINLYVQNNGQFRFPLFLRSEHDFLANLESRDLITWGLLGVMLALALLNLLNASLLANKFLFYYAMFILLFIFLLFHDYGYARLIVWGYHARPDMLSMRILQGSMILFGILFADTFFKQFKLHWSVRRGYAGFFIVTIITLLATPFIDNWKILSANLVVTVFLLSFTIGTAMYLVYKRHFSAFYFLLAWVLIAIGVVTYALTSMGFFPYTFLTTHSMQIGASAGFIIFALLITHDLKKVQKEQIEASRRRVVEVEDTHRLKEMFVGTVSHDIHTALNNIIGKISKMQPSTIYETKTLQSLGKSAGTLSMFLSSILALDEVLSSQEDRVSSFDAALLLKNVAHLMKPFLGQSIHELTVSADGHSCYMKGEKQAFIKILMGLIFNVLQHADSSSLTLAIETKGKQIFITIQDEGEGMTDVILASVKRKFVKEKNTHISKNRITAVNFSEISMLLSLLKGTIKIDSVVGEGTTITLSFPQITLTNDMLAADKHNSAILHQKKRDTQETILIVDDEPINRKILQNFLHQGGYGVLQASNKEEMLAVLHDKMPRLILMDIMLPGTETGIDLVKIIRRTHDKLSLPILFVSAHSDVETLEKAYSGGGNGFIVKPIDRALLMHKIKIWMELSEI